MTLHPQEKPLCLGDGKEKRENGKMWVTGGQGQVTARSLGNMVPTLPSCLSPPPKKAAWYLKGNYSDSLCTILSTLI